MTLTEALEKVDSQMDEISVRILSEAEEFIRGAGATDDECAAYLDRKRAELSDARGQVHEITRTAYWTGLDSPSVRVN
ncbi:MAG: hypothetical protein H0W53_08685 [Acidobacteria bacterium]|jgi:Uri superfamily endonuclease|nr:hypothetical protein [Acidobacteriota bacterium]